jgi:cytochrome P450 family 9
MVCDAEAIRKIGIKDFDYFVDHRQYIPNEDPGDSLFGNSLFMLTGQKWRDMRATLSPAFTGSKMRKMFELVSVCGQQLADYFREELAKLNGTQEFEMKDLFTRFANDVIASTAFGFQVDSFRDKDNQFYYFGKNIFNFNNPTIMLKFLCMRFAPKLCRKLKIDFLNLELAEYFRKLIHEAFEDREQHHIIRQDIVNILLRLRKGQQIKDGQPEEEKDEAEFAVVKESDIGKLHVTRKWSDSELIAQSFLFFLAGFDSVSTAMTFLSYELAIHPDIQQRLYEEIKAAHDSLEGKPLTYEVVQKMIYLDMVIAESLRLWPPAPIVDRYCVKDYLYEDNDGLKFKIEKGHALWIPIVGLHHDERYYKDAGTFNPERFSPENRKDINLNAYLPFGVGPRNCIGSRFALMEVKIAMYYLLLHFSFELSEKTELPFKLISSFGGLTAEKGIFLKLKMRE